jgi:hypothetical protein
MKNAFETVQRIYSFALLTTTIGFGCGRGRRAL